MNDIRPPTLAETLLARSIPAGSRDSVLGDLREGYEEIAVENSILAAKAWYWAETLRALPSFWSYSLETSTVRRQTVTGTFFYRERGWTIFVSLLLLIPALLLVIPGLLFEVFGKPIEAGMNAIPGLAILRTWTDSPWLVLGGVGIALLVNLIAVMRVELRLSKEEVQTTLTWRRSTTNFLLLGFALLLGLALFGYGVAENLLPLL